MKLWLAAGAVLLILWNLPDAITWRMKAAMRESIAPLQELMSDTSRNISETTRSIRSLTEVVEENRRLSTELLDLREAVRKQKQFEFENAALRRQLGFKERSELFLASAEVIGRDISGWWQSIRINKGELDGLAPGQAVLTPDGVIGKTVDVSLRTSDVLLLTDPNCRVAALVPRVNGFGIVSGQGITWNGLVLLRMKFINRNLPLRVGDEVITSGLGGVFPRGLRVGQVERVEASDSGLHVEAEIIPAANFEALNYAFISVEDEWADEQNLLQERLSRLPEVGL